MIEITAVPGVAPDFPADVERIDPTPTGWRVWQTGDDIPPLPGPSLDALKAAACARLQAEKWARMMGKFRDSTGHLYDVDSDSRALLGGKVTTINAGKALPAGFVWKTAEKDIAGQTMYAPHTAQTLVALAFEIDDWTEAVFRASEAAQASILSKSVTTEEQIAAIEAAVSWPDN